MDVLTEEACVDVAEHIAAIALILGQKHHGEVVEQPSGVPEAPQAPEQLHPAAAHPPVGAPGPGDDVADLPGTRAEALPPARAPWPEGCGPAQAHEREAASPGGPTAADASRSGTVQRPLCLPRGTHAGHRPIDRCKFSAWKTDEPEASQDLPAPSVTDSGAERLARLRFVDPRDLREMLQNIIRDAVEYALEKLTTWPVPHCPPPNFPTPRLPAAEDLKQLQPVPEDGEQPGEDEADEGEC